MLGLITGALGSLMGSGTIATIAKTGMELLPSLAQGMSGDRDNRTILDVQNKRSELQALQQQSEITKKARQTMATARSMMAGSGFQSGVGSQSIMTDESLSNMMQNIDISRYNFSSTGLADQIKATGEFKDPYSDFSKQFGSSVLKPLAKKGLKGLESLFSNEQ
jgi:hypothetical protein